MSANPEMLIVVDQGHKPNQAATPESVPHGWLLFAAVFGITVVLLQGYWNPQVPVISNVYIPDSLNLFYGTLSSVGIDWSNLFQSSSTGLKLFYGPFKLIDPRLFFVPNLVMWLACIWVTYRIFSPIDVRAAQFSIIAIVFNPYLLLGLSGPTKELPLLLLVLLFLLIEPVWKYLPLFAIVIAITYVIRDGYAFIMIAWLGLHVLLPKLTWKLGRIVLCLTPLVILLGISLYAAPFSLFDQLEQEAKWISSPSDVGSQNLQRALESLKDPWLVTREFGFRILANGFSDLVRPSLTTVSNRISVLGLGFFIHSYFLAFGLAAVVLTCVLPVGDERLEYLAWFVALVWAVVSLILFIQPRYLMPITPVAMGIFGSRTSATKLIIIVAVIAASVLGLLVLTYGFNIRPVISVDNPVKPPFFFGSD